MPDPTPPPTILSTPAPTPPAPPISTDPPASPPADFLESSPKDWKLPDDLKEWKSHEKFPKGIELVRAYKNLEVEMSRRQSVKPPGEGAKAEEIAAWRELVGVPKTPEDYGLKAPEKLPEGVQWNDAFAKEFAAFAHAENLPTATVHKLIDFHNANLSKMTEQGKAAQVAAVAETRAALEKEWGAESQQNTHLAANMAKSLGVDLEDATLANNPIFIKAMHAAALRERLLTSENGPLINGTNAPSWGETGEAKLEKLRAHPDYLAGGPKALAIQEQMKRIHDSMQKK